MPGTRRKGHQAAAQAQLIAIPLRYCINTHLEDQAITMPASIGGLLVLSEIIGAA
jgi:hypothetical protein